jgi:indolepyruvate ferredoxin oxidoreductase beta subunit
MTVVIGAKQYPESILENLRSEHDVYALDGQKIALELGNSKVLNSVVLGYAAKFIGFNKDAWLNTVASTVPQKTVEINKKAFEEGYGLHG